FMQPQESKTSQTAAPKQLFPPWSPFIALLLVVAIFVGSQLLGFAVLWLYTIARGWTASQAQTWVEQSTTAQFVYILIAEAVTVGLLYLYIRRHNVSFCQLGLVRPGWRDAGIALVAIPFYAIGYGLVLTAITSLFPGINVDQEQQIGFDAARGILALTLTYISLAILPPLVEEITMRGFAYTSLRKRFRYLGAAIITSIIFAIAHLQVGSGAPLLWVAAIDTFVLSMVLCYMRERTGSLWPGIFLHGLKNSVAFFALFVFHLA
ncbi:MAG TPA: CPBP family intramembrane glutamic endopeptidase, partial [Candidatus Limnocylindrales bacterium]|nr:CPBP family intramembrane glutamic endopeptidase [Candidatus Limnocylindrales bacterium]